MTVRVGQRFENYQLLRLLGDGTFGEVYLGERLSDQMQVAVKILNTSLTKQKDLADFLNEARTIKLEHPHIVKLHDFGIQDGALFLVMTYALNGTVRERHPEGTVLPLEEPVISDPSFQTTTSWSGLRQIVKHTSKEKGADNV